jgi:hypothetical protein
MARYTLSTFGVAREQIEASFRAIRPRVPGSGGPAVPGAEHGTAPHVGSVRLRERS